jgi:hypothetical protein
MMLGESPDIMRFLAGPSFTMTEVISGIDSEGTGGSTAYRTLEIRVNVKLINGRFPRAYGTLNQT